MSTGTQDNGENRTPTPSRHLVPPFYHDANPALKLTTEPLSGNNYLSWSDFVLLALGAKSLLNYITDVKRPLETDTHYAQWIVTDKLVRL